MFQHFDDFHSDTLRFAYKALGNAARIQCTYAVRNHLSKLRAGTADPVDHIDTRAEGLDDAADIIINDGEVEALRMQGNDDEAFHGHGTTPDEMPAIHRAQYLDEVATAAESEAKSISTSKYDMVMSYADVLAFFSTPGKSKALNEAQLKSLESLKAQGMITAESLEQGQKLQAAQDAIRWKNDSPEVLAEITSFALDDVADADAESGQTAFDKLPPWVAIRLYDSVILKVRQYCSKFVSNILLGKVTSYKVEDADGIARVVLADLKKLEVARRAFYKQHQAQIESGQI